MVYYQVHEIMLAKNDITVIPIVNITFHKFIKSTKKHILWNRYYMWDTRLVDNYVSKLNNTFYNQQTFWISESPNLKSHLVFLTHWKVLKIAYCNISSHQQYTSLNTKLLDNKRLKWSCYLLYKCSKGLGTISACSWSMVHVYPLSQ